PARDRRRAGVTSLEAGYAAERIYAFPAAHTSFTRAVELMDALAGDDLPPEVGLRDRPDLLEHAARAASAVGDHDGAGRLGAAAPAPRAPSATTTGRCGWSPRPWHRSRSSRRTAYGCWSDWPPSSSSRVAVTARGRRTPRLWSSWS